MGDCMKIKGKSLLVLRIFLLLSTLALMVFIFSNSTKTADVSSESSGRIMDMLNRICTALNLRFTFDQVIVRTLAHFCEFGLLGVLTLCTAICFFKVKLKSFFLSVSVFCLTAVTDECIQIFSDGRAFQFSDLIIDISGGLLGATAVFLIALLINNHNLKIQKRNSYGKSNGE